MEFSMEKLAPYLFQTVLLTLADNSGIEGELTEAQSDRVKLTVKRKVFSEEGTEESTGEEVLTFFQAELRDIECVDEVREYHNFAEKVELRSGYQVALSDLIPGTDLKLIVYGDRTCRVACHVEKAGDLLVARDVRLLSAVYKHNSLMASCNLLYFLEDGRRVVGHLDDGVLVTPKGARAAELEMKDIRDVSKPAELNDYVFVTLSDAQTIKGVVSKADPEFFVVDGKRYFYKDVDDLRFRGTIRIVSDSRDPKRRITSIRLPNGEVYQYRRAYYSDPGMEAIATDGAQAIFSAGIGDKGKIAKEIEVIADPNATESGVGLALMFPRRQALGFIGNTYAVAKEDQKPGDISFTADDMGDFKPQREQIYAAYYTCAKKASEAPRPVTEVTFEPTGYTRDEYARVWVDENNEIHGEKRASPRKEADGPCVILGDFLVDMPVELVLKDDDVVFGRVTGCVQDQDHDQVTLEMPTADGLGQREFSHDDIAQMRLYGQITQWIKPKGIGYLCGSKGIYFHISSLENGKLDEPYIVLGAWVSFAMRWSEKRGKKGEKQMEACDISIAHEKRSGWLKEYQVKGDMAAIFPAGFRQDESFELQPLIQVGEELSIAMDRAGTASAADSSRGYCAIQYVLLKGGRENYRVPLGITQENRRHLGFLCNTVPQGKMVKGHVAPMDAWDAYLKGRLPKKRYYFQPTLLRSPANGDCPDASVHSYWVSYVCYRVDGKNFDAAKEVTILAELDELPQTAIRAIEETSPTAPEEDLDLREEELNLREELEAVLADPDKKYEGASWKLGLIWTWGWNGRPTNIRKTVYHHTAPKSLKRNGSFAVLYDPEDTEGMDSELAYLVRYVEAAPSGEDAGKDRRVDMNYPVQVLKTFKKSVYIGLVLPDEKEPVLRGYHHPKPKRAPVSELIPTEEQLALIDGETVLLQQDDALKKYTVRKAEDGTVRLHAEGDQREPGDQSNLTVDEDLTMEDIEGLRLYRFGIMDSYDAKTGHGTLNGCVKFSIGAAQRHVIHAIKTYPTVLSIRLQVLYACEGDYVVDIRAETESKDICKAVGPQEQGVVTAVLDPKRVIIGEGAGAAECNLSGLSNSRINSLFQNEMLTKEEVLFRRVAYCTGDGKLGYLALDVRPFEVKELERPQAKSTQSEAEPNDPDAFSDNFFKVPKDRRLDEFRDRAEKVGRALGGQNSDISDGEHAYYLWQLLCDPPAAGDSPKNLHTRSDLLYRLFLRAFDSSDSLKDYIEGRKKYISCISKDQAPPDDAVPVATQEKLKELFARKCTNIALLAANLAGLDDSSATVCLSCIEANEDLAEQLCDYVKKGFPSFSGDAGEAVEKLRSAIRDNDRRDEFQYALSESSLSICAKLACEALEKKKAYDIFLHKKDRERFVELRGYCSVLCEKDAGGSTDAHIKKLDKARWGLQRMAQSIRKHPSQHAVELFLTREGEEDSDKCLLARLQAFATQNLRKKCEDPDLAPELQCVPINQVVVKDSKSTFLHIKNMRKTSLTAEDIKLTLMSFTSGLDDPQTEYSLGDIPEGGSRIVEVTWRNCAADEISLEWEIEYTCITGLKEDGSVDRGRQLLKSDEATAIGLKVVEATDPRVKKFPGDQPPENPYSEGDDALSAGSNLFFGRNTEKKMIMDLITTEGGTRLKPGSAVLVYGQKRCGKSSLIEQIEGDIKESPYLGQEAIILEYSDISQLGLLPKIASGDFTATWYRVVALDFLDAMPKDMKQELSHRGITEDLFPASCDTVETAIRFKRLMTAFQEVDQGKHCVVLIMDEFTRFTAELYKQCKKQNDPRLADQALFITRFKEYPFVQIIIGHDTMVRNLGELGLTNSITDKNSKVKVTALPEKDARDMIREPIDKALGREEHPVYDGKLGGDKAIRALCDLSGRSPYLLTKLCRAMYDYYVAPYRCSVNQTWLNDDDVERVVGSYLEKLSAAPTEFDMLTTEDGDGDTCKRDNIIRYLETLALMSPDGEERRVSSDDLCNKLGWPEKQFNEIAELLEARDVIEKNKDGIRIIAGLYVRHIKEKKESKGGR